MPINEQVIDALDHVLQHYFADHPDVDGVMAGELADYTGTIACGACMTHLAAAVGADCGHLACAIATVWQSEVWAAHEARMQAEDD